MGMMKDHYDKIFINSKRYERWYCPFCDDVELQKIAESTPENTSGKSMFKLEQVE